MRKRYKMLVKCGKIYILRWSVDGKLFGPDWDVSASFDETAENLERSKQIIKLMNDCEKNASCL